MAAPTPQEVVQAAESWLGVPYLYGGTTRRGVDCSALVQDVFGGFGVHLPRTSEEQFKAGKPVTADQLQPGDLVFTAGSDGSASSPGHVGIYIGRGQVLNAPHTGTNVRVEDLAGWRPVGYRRVIGTASSSTGDGGGVTDASFPGSGLLSWPSDVLGFFSGATDHLDSAARWFAAFTRPSTWVRIGAGALGTTFLIAGLVFLVMAAGQEH